MPGGCTMMFGVTRSNYLFGGIVCCIIFLSSQIVASSYVDAAFAEYTSLGQATTAAQGNVAAAFSNPALLSTLKKSFIGSQSSSRYDSDISIHNIYATQHIKGLDLGLHVPVKQISNISETEANNSDEGVEIGSLSDIQIELQLSVSKCLTEHVSVGMSLKGEAHKLANETAKGIGLDLGLATDFNSVNVGARIENIVSKKIWSTGQEESLPTLYHLGVSYSPFETIMLLSDIVLGETKTLNLAAITQLTKNLSIQSGVADVLDTKKWGLGLDLDLSGFHITYSMSSAHVLGANHTLGVSLAY